MRNNQSIDTAVRGQRTLDTILKDYILHSTSPLSRHHSAEHMSYCCGVLSTSAKSLRIASSIASESVGSCFNCTSSTFSRHYLLHQSPCSSRVRVTAGVADMCGEVRQSWYEDLKLSLKKNDKVRESRYFQIASVDADGMPSNRTVVYRGFLPQGGQVNQSIVTFVTDRRSNKVSHCANFPFVEIAWYFPVTREQYRLKGIMQVVSLDDGDAALLKAREMAWRNMSDPGRQQFLWPNPGHVRTGNDEDQFNKQDLPGKDAPVAPEFCLCCVHIVRVDHLSLKNNERVEHISEYNGMRAADILDSRHSSARWQTRRINP